MWVLPSILFRLRNGVTPVTECLLTCFVALALVPNVVGRPVVVEEVVDAPTAVFSNPKRVSFEFFYGAPTVALRW
jgi:hypothetical protein